MGIIIKPIVTEKQTAITEKMDIRQKSRYTKSGIINGKQSAFKKAIVTLKEGETIDFFSNI